MCHLTWCDLSEPEEVDTVSSGGVGIHTSASDN